MSTELARETPPTVVGDAIRFNARFEGRATQQFEISGDALVEHFGAASRNADDLLAAFKLGKTAIVDAAGKAQGMPVNDVVLLGTGDFPQD
jgi:hypothetical protein